MNKLHMLILAGLMATTMPFASMAADKPAQTIDAGATFQLQRDTILKALDDGETYAEISRQDRDRVREMLSRIEVLLGR